MRKSLIFKLIHPILIFLMKTQRQHQLHILMPKPVYSENVIYAVNHSCRYDVPIVGEVVGRHTYLLVGKQRLEFIDRICFLLNGVVWVDRLDKKSKQKAYHKMLSLLKQGENVCIFPEGTWNLSPSKPMLPLHWGVISLAKETQCPIQPLVLEYKKNECWVNFAPLFLIKKEDIKEIKIKELEDIFARLKWEIWERFPIQHRDESMDLEWKNEIARRIAEYPKLNQEYESRCIRK